MRVENPRVLAAFTDLGVEHCPGERLADWTSLGVGGPTDILVIHEPRHMPELVRLLDAEGLPRRFLGGGSNLLVREGELRWVLLHLSDKEARPKFHGNCVRVAAAADLGRTVTECAKHNLGGVEGLIGVPGSVGGALRMNAGAYGIEISHFVKSVELYRAATRTIETLPSAAIGFHYRHTSFAAGDIMISAELELPEKPYEEIRAAIKVCNEKRRASQPLNEKSAGCIFKNPPGASAGKMIDELGLKGHRLGGAVVSERHANFFVNRFQATAEDLLGLIGFVRERVRQAFGYNLEEEVIVWAD
ncbi:MAG: UDP-N-acetylmuramate dehydrogenase [Acidobacteria bacterium]|nr:UDP-N-acetylmuramate dehydrogenase [Acidobacteriota bacterium]